MFYTTISKNSNKILLYHSPKVPITISLEWNQKIIIIIMVLRFEQYGDWSIIYRNSKRMGNILMLREYGS